MAGNLTPEEEKQVQFGARTIHTEEVRQPRGDTIRLLAKSHDALRELVEPDLQKRWRTLGDYPESSQGRTAQDDRKYDNKCL